MALILNIDTSVTGASICLSEDGSVSQFMENPDSRSHSGWLHPSIETVMRRNETLFENLDAVAVTIGPGSYTGLRVGLSAAKGLCYALDKPLITIGTLEMMAETLRQKYDAWICPMIDARRMEVFTALFNEQLTIMEPPQALVLETGSFEKHLHEKKIIFAGNGAIKMQQMTSNKNASFDFSQFNAADMRLVSQQYYQQKIFSDLAYVEPLYLKEFHFATAHQ